MTDDSVDQWKDYPIHQYFRLFAKAFSFQLWRALRLVLDVGLHSKGMNRQEGLDLLAKYAWDTSDVAQKEMTRYQSGAGQASAYMIGQLTIQNLREYAEEMLKDDFNLKEFHYQVKFVI